MAVVIRIQIRRRSDVNLSHVRTYRIEIEMPNLIR